MCLSQTVNKSGIGYQVRIKNWDGTYSPIYQNKGDQYKIGKYYKARSSIYDRKVHGFHIFLTLTDAKKYKKNMKNNSNAIIVEVRFRNLITYGLHKVNYNYSNGSTIFAAAITAREVKILKEVK